MARVPSEDTAEALAVARGMASVLTSQPSAEAGALGDVLLAAAPMAGNWDTRAALLWTLITAERFGLVDAALPAMIEAVGQSGSARGLIAAYSSLGFLKLRLGSLPEADGAARIALGVLREGDFSAGMGVAGIVAEVPSRQGNSMRRGPSWPGPPVPRSSQRAGTGCDGPLNLARGDGNKLSPASSPCDVQPLLLLGERERARTLAGSELADARVFGGRRALGIALRVAGLAQGGTAGLRLLGESVEVLQDSPALLERAKSLAELGAALRRAGQRTAARPPLAQALDLAAGCGARPLAGRAYEELTAAGGRPRRERRHGVDALTPSELRVARLAAEGRTNRQIAHGLYVTPKTVETHLAHAYAKLGISQRNELPQALAGGNLRVLTQTRTGAS